MTPAVELLAKRVLLQVRAKAMTNAQLDAELETATPSPWRNAVEVERKLRLDLEWAKRLSDPHTYQTGETTRRLDRFTDDMDAALYTASCFCRQEPQYIYTATHADFVPEGEERYLILDESDPKRSELHAAWQPTYKLERLE